MKRLFDLYPSEIKDLNGSEILQSINATEGRAFVSEIIAPFPPILGDVSNPEVAAAFGADIILVNMYDAANPFINGIDSENPLSTISDLTGRLVAVNLEPIDYSAELSVSRESVSTGRIASLENVKLLYEAGCRIVVLTGNPATGVSSDAMAKSVMKIKNEFGDKIIIIAGKMHSAGVISETGASIIDEYAINDLVSAGTDIILVPAPGTIPGFTLERVSNLISHIHNMDKLAMTAIGTSQEGADIQTIRTIALNAKMAGADIHHIGDCGMSPGIASPENIMAYSIAIRGKRHTYRVMAKRG